MAGAGLPQNTTRPQTAPQSKGPVSNAGQPTYQPIGVNNPPASYNPVAPVPNDQSPYKMNEVTDGNMQQNQNTQETNDYSTMLPANTLAQGQTKSWYPGMYPSSQPQFGVNPYSPQTFNIQGHPGQNPSVVNNLEPNNPNDAYSNQGQFQQVKTMATGGNSFAGPAATWNGPANTNAISGQDLANTVLTSVLSGKGSPAPTTSPKSTVVNTFSPAQANVQNPQPINPVSKDPVLSDVFSALGKGPTTPTSTPVSAAPTPTSAPQVYRPQYTQYAPIKTNVDSYGNPLFNSGGLASIPRKK